MAATSGEMDEVIREFLVESAEGVDVLDRDLVALEREPNSPELLAEIFRSVHTLKGNSGVLGYPKLAAVAHAAEDLLTELRDGRLSLTRERTDGLLAVVDALRALLTEIEENGNEGDGDYSPVIGLVRGASGSAGATKGADERVASGVEIADSARLPPLRMTKQTAANGAAEAAPLQIRGAPTAFGTPPENLRAAVAASPGSIRVGVGLLDSMMNQVGELVLARNQVLHVAAGHSDAILAKAAQRLKSVTSGLQASVMKARMQPIGRVWNKFPRLVRDLAAQCGKQITVEMKGAEIELDGTILETIKDPLTHILRNAIDHGIESPGERIGVGKSATGQVRLSAFHEGGRVHVEISDDGAGINLESTRQRAVERGLITAEQAAGMSEREAARLVFTPGFSTAETVTNLSGRGVGLDVVRTNIERIGGVVGLQSVRGQGTTLKLELPLTLAILPVLIVSSGGERFAIPQGNLLELVRLETEQGPNAIEQICGAPVYRLRDRLLPLVFLDRELHLAQRPAGALHIVVLQAGARQFGLVVDPISDTEEIVVKPLSRQLKGLSCFAGAGILADGKVVPVLDVMGVAQSANLGTGLPSQARNTTMQTAPNFVPTRQTWLTFRGAAGSRFALPMSAVARIEELSARKVERSQGREVVQYRGEILPLLRVSELLHQSAPERELLQVLVLYQGDEKVGLVVDGIEDIVEETVESPPAGGGDWRRGPAVIQGRVADVLDVERVLALAGKTVTRPAAAGGR